MDELTPRRPPDGLRRRPFLALASASAAWAGEDPVLPTEPVAERAGLSRRPVVGSAVLGLSGTAMHGGGGLSDALPAAAKAAPKPSVAAVAVFVCPQH